MVKVINSFEAGRVTLSGNEWTINPNIFLARIYCVKSGWAKIYLGAEERILEKGNYYFFYQSNDFKIIDSRDFDHIYFNITLNFPINNNTFITLNPDDVFLKHAFECVNSFICDHSKLYMHQISSYTSTVDYLLEAIFDYIDKTCTITHADNHFVWKAVEMIAKDPSNITVTSLAKSLNINEHHFIRSFKKKMATTPMHYIRFQRLSNGLALLKNGETVEKVAEKCGYASSTAFITAFKRQFGVSPKKARNVEYL